MLFTQMCTGNFICKNQYYFVDAGLLFVVILEYTLGYPRQGHHPHWRVGDPEGARVVAVGLYICTMQIYVTSQNFNAFVKKCTRKPKNTLLCQLRQNLIYIYFFVSLQSISFTQSYTQAPHKPKTPFRPMVLYTHQFTYVCTQSYLGLFDSQFRHLFRYVFRFAFQCLISIL